jgi:hypothetical protein
MYNANGNKFFVAIVIPCLRIFAKIAREQRLPYVLSDYKIIVYKNWPKFSLQQYSISYRKIYKL